MALARPDRLPINAPAVPPPPPFLERRREFRRAEDREIHQERVLLARAMDLLAADRPAESRLAELLQLLADTCGARRAAIVSDGAERRVTIAIHPHEARSSAAPLAAWLDATAPRTRAQRAAAGLAPVSFAVIGGEVDTADESSQAAATDAESTDAPDVLDIDRHFAWLDLPSTGSVAIGFEFDTAADADRLEERLPASLARHAAAALSLIAERLASERELASLRAGEAERTRYVSTVAHELRTPLTGLGGYLSLILAGSVEDGATQREFLERSQSIVGSMNQLVGDLLEMSRIESGTLRLEVAPFSLADVGGRVLAHLEPIAADRGVELRSSLPPRLRAALGDGRRVEQILTNLVANALKFGGASSTVELAGWFDGSVAIVAIRDEGPGIEPEDRGRIFERFFRMRAHERVTGTGLGLPIARDLARSMDGDLDVASVPGSGSTFVLALPGPAGVDRALLDETLERVIATEEIALEERSVVRAIRASGRPVPAHPRGRPHLTALPGNSSAQAEPSLA